MLYGQSRFLYGLTRQQAYAGNGGSERIPSVDTMGLDVAAGDGDVAPIRNFADEHWQQLGRMLQVGMNYAQQVGISVCPAIRDGACQSSLSRPHQKTYPRFRFRNRFTTSAVPSELWSSTTRISHTSDARDKQATILLSSGSMFAVSFNVGTTR
jgi:hypothetical protein